MITLKIDHFKSVKLDFFGFSGGERNVRILGLDYDNNEMFSSMGMNSYDYFKNSKVESYTVTAKITCSDDLMDLILLKDAIDRTPSLKRCKNSILHLPYLPYARQDRPMVDGEALSVKVVARLINDLGFNEVWIDDPHSDVGTALIENVVVTTQAELLLHIRANTDMFSSDTILVAPDAGALKKIYALASKTSLEVGVGSKHRDVATGKITGTSYSGPDVTGKRCLMGDDIADGGATFEFLAAKLKELGARQVDLYVTHGIFSKGVDGFKYLDNVYTAYPWEKYVKGKNERNILSTVDIVEWFK